MSEKINVQEIIITNYGLSGKCPYCQKEVFFGIVVRAGDDEECINRECPKCKNDVHFRNGVAYTKTECSKIQR